jgi:hypothetical protein
MHVRDSGGFGDAAYLVSHEILLIATESQISATIRPT